MNDVALQMVREALALAEEEADTAGRKAGMEFAASFLESFGDNLLNEGLRDRAQLCDGLANRIRALIRAGKIRP